MGKGEVEEPQGLKSQVVSFIFQSLCSIAIPVALSFYFAPEKSYEYFQNTVQDKVDSVASIELDQVYELGLNVFREVPPMLDAEYDVLKIVSENAPIALQHTAYIVLFDWRITLGLSLFSLIAWYLFPFQECKDWLLNVAWGSVCVVAGFLPLDSGMDVLADKEAGVYRMTVTLSAVIITLVANYLVVILIWWSLGKLMGWMWSGLVSLVWKKKKVVEDVEVRVEETKKEK